MQYHPRMSQADQTLHHHSNHRRLENLAVIFLLVVSMLSWVSRAIL